LAVFTDLISNREAWLRVARFHPDAAGPADLEQFFEVERAASEHDRPHDSPPTLKSVTGRLTQPQRQYWESSFWTGGPPGQLVGTAALYRLGEQNPHLAAVDVTVHPKHRRRGVATALLRLVTAGAAEADLRTLLAEGVPAGGPGQAWARALGFVLVERTARQSLDMAQADRSSWQVGGPTGYRLARWIDSAPEDLLASYATARNAIGDRPRGDTTYVDAVWTPQRVRADETAAIAGERQTRVVVAVHEQTAQVAGLTYLEVRRRRPDLATQQDTVVLPAHRGHRLGVWMKAANLDWLAADHPQVTRVVTSTAADNEHMLRINRQVGFTVDAATENWEADVTGLLTRLNG
jgi:mycothiol synthase